MQSWENEPSLIQDNQDLKLTNQIKNHHKQQFQFEENKFKA